MSKTRIDKLRALQNDPAATPAERATAKRVADRLERANRREHTAAAPPPAVEPAPRGPGTRRAAGPTGYAEDYTDALWGNLRRAAEKMFSGSDEAKAAVLDAVDYTATEGAKGIRFTVVIPYSLDQLSPNDRLEVVVEAIDQLDDIAVEFIGRRFGSRR